MTSDIRLDLMNACTTFDPETSAPIVMLTGRTEDKKLKRIKIEGFKPYFYEPDDNGEYLSVFNKPLKKVELTMTSEVLQRRTMDSHEADIPFHWRYLIDKGIKCGFRVVNGSEIEACEQIGVKPRTCYYDIEVMSPPHIFPKGGKWPIVVVGSLDSYTGKYKEFWIGDYGSPGSDDELRMIVDFFDMVRQKYDVVNGYYAAHYDFPELSARAASFGGSINRISPLGNVTRRGSTFETGGITIADTFDWYLEMMKSRGRPPTDLDLKSVVNYELGYKYEDFGSSIEKLYNEDPDTLKQYCRNDVEAVWKLDNTLQITTFFDNIRRVAGCGLNVAHVRSWVTDMVLLRLGKEMNLVLPSRPTGMDEKETYRAAIVKEPVPGLYEDIAVFDLKSAYPRIIIENELSPDPNKIIPKMVAMLMAKREEMKKIHRDVIAAGADPESKEVKLLYYKEQTFKYLVNSIYGSLAYPRYRLYDPTIPPKVTKQCRKAIIAADRELRPKYEVVYADTDSVFVRVGYFDVEFVENILSDILPQHVGKGVDIEYEKYYRKLIFKGIKKKRYLTGVKKRYIAHCTRDGFTRVDYLVKKGVEVKRSDSSVVTRRVMEEFFETLMIKDNVKGALDVVRDEVKKFKKNPLTDVAIPKGLSKPLRKYGDRVTMAQVTGLKYAIEHFDILERQDRRPKAIRVKTVKGKPKTTYIAFYTEDQIDMMVKKGVVIDWEYMVESTIKRQLEGFLLVLGYDWETVIEGHKQVGLGEWI